MSQTPRRQGRAGEVLRGLGAVVGLAVLVAAVPYGLWRIDGSPLPSSLPDLQDITDTLTSRDDGSFFVSVLILAGWIGWATFAVAVLVEIPAAIRGVRAPRMPALSAQQRLAAGLITAISAMLAAGPVAAGSAIADEHAGQPTSVQHAQPPVTVDSLQPPTADEPPKQDGSAAEAPAQDQTDRYVVQPGDTLWDISDRKLDDPTRYPEIVEASADTVQPDGRRLTDPDLIIPGWELVIPAESDAGAVSQSPDRSAAGDNTDQTAPPTTGQDTTTPDT